MAPSPNQIHFLIDKKKDICIDKQGLIMKYTKREMKQLFIINSPLNGKKKKIKQI